jgi:hypothetical protein
VLTPGADGQCDSGTSLPLHCHLAPGRRKGFLRPVAFRNREEECLRSAPTVDILKSTKVFRQVVESGRFVAARSSRSAFPLTKRFINLRPVPPA